MGPEEFDEKFWMLRWLLLEINVDSKSLYETSYIWKCGLQLAFIFII